MWINLHAVLLLATPIGVLVTLLACKRRAPSWPLLLVSIIIAAVLMLWAMMLTQSLCDSGTPVSQWLLPGVCLVLVLVLVRSFAVRTAVATVLTILMFGLSLHYTVILDQPGWTGNPRSIRFRLSGMFLGSLQAEALTLATEPDVAQAEYPAGWLRELPVWSKFRDSSRKRYLFRAEVHSAWHTWFTQLYPYDHIDQDFWYPGGPFAQGINQILVRDRPMPDTSQAKPDGDEAPY